MTKEDIILFRRDVAARLPYEPIVVNKRFDGGYGQQLYFGSLSISKYFDSANIDDTKIYLRPMSSMTEEEKKYKELYFKYDYLSWEYTDWLNAHHFDYRGLIEKGLALEAPEGMYKL